MIKVGVLLSQAHHWVFSDLTVAAEELGYESVWLGEHVVSPINPQGTLTAQDEPPPLGPSTPILGVTEVLSYLAARTSRIRLGTFVYLLGLRHPFQSARAFMTLDVLSAGRIEIGVGAGWLRTEWEAVGADFNRRGECLDEALAVCSALWTEPEVAHAGKFFTFPPVGFEPKPVQNPVPMAIGGESMAALRRAARFGQGWLGMTHTPRSAAAKVAALRGLEKEVGRDAAPVMVSVVGELSDTQPPQAWEAAGVDRLIVHPWRRTSDAIDAVTRLAGDFLDPRHPREPKGANR